MHKSTVEKRSRLLLLAAGAFALSGCIDDSYDFDKFDNSMQIEVKDLTLPLDLKPLEFSSVVDLTDQECVEIGDNGEYVMLKKGDFESEMIEIQPLIASADVEAFDSQPIEILGVAGMKVPFDASQYARFDFDFSYDQVDAYIRDITHADVDFNIYVTISSGLSCVYTNMVFMMPEGMTGDVVGATDSYGYHDAANPDLIHFDRVESADGEFKFTYHVNRIDVAKANGHLTPDANGEYGKFTLSNSIALRSGEIEARETATGSLSARFDLGKIEVHTFDGSVKYTIDDFVESATLDDLPDMLNDPSTVLGLVNPQLYIRVNNPFGQYGAEASVNISLSQYRPDGGFLPESVRSVTTSNPLQITDSEADQQFVLAPSEPDYIYDAFAGVRWNPAYALPGMGGIVYGEGLPSALDFSFISPMLDSDHVHGFPIGRPVDRVHGEYAFYAPLDFSAGSHVVYSQTQTGWGVDSDDNLLIEAFRVEANVTSNLPVSVILSAYPVVLDENDNPVVDTESRIEPKVIPANASGYSLVLELTGASIRRLDGMKYTVELLSDGSGNSSALAPDMALDLSEFKVTVSGHYVFNEDEYDD